MKMKIYLVSTNDCVHYDEYDAVVVIAEDEQDALALSKECCDNFKNDLTAKEIGIANKEQVRGEVLASYNAG